MKYILAIILAIAILAMIANGPLFTFAWLMTQRTFMACIICFCLGYIMGKR